MAKQSKAFNIEEETLKDEVYKETNVKEGVAEASIVKRDVPEVKYREVVYLGIADICERVGIVTGNHYRFGKDSYGMSVSTNIDERDYPALVSEKGKGCARRDPEILFMSKLEWDLELQQARIANSN